MFRGNISHAFSVLNLMPVSNVLCLAYSSALKTEASGSLRATWRLNSPEVSKNPLTLEHVFSNRYAAESFNYINGIFSLFALISCYAYSFGTTSCSSSEFFRTTGY
jgi:hypothetical protein